MTTPTTREVQLETARRRIEAMQPDPIEDLQREIDRHASNAWIANRRPGARTAHAARAAELQSQMDALLNP